MFGIKHNECVGFESRWKVKKVSTNVASQTAHFSQNEKGTSTVSTDSIEIQTEPPESATSLGEVNMDKLAIWLQKIYPSVKKEIDDANNSHAFKGYRLQKYDEADCKLLQKIIVSNITSGKDKVSKKVSTVTWNQTGKTLAFSCNFEHRSWCHHSGSVFIYTLLGNEKLADQPNKKLKTESCIVCLTFHPVRPSILAGSTFSGAVIVWNIHNEDGEEIMTNLNAHEETVTQILWINDIKTEKGHLLVSTGTDGLLKLWKYDATGENILSLRTRYKVKPPLLSSFRRNNESPALLTKVSSGIICFDFSKHVQDMFLVGLEGGHIVQCSLLGATKLKGSTKEEPLMDPSFKYYEPHEGEVVSVSFSPNRKEMFMTYGTDAEIRIYLIGQEDPAQLIFLKSTLLDLAFVPYEEKLIAGCGLKGFMEIFHLQQAKPVKDITTEEFKNKVTSTCLAINGNKNNLVALGSKNGELQLWNVPWRSFLNK